MLISITSAERQGFEPWKRLCRLRTFQARSFDQLGHLSFFVFSATFLSEMQRYKKKRYLFHFIVKNN